MVGLVPTGGDDGASWENDGRLEASIIGSVSDPHRPPLGLESPRPSRSGRLRGEILKDVQLHVLTVYGHRAFGLGSTSHVLLACRAYLNLRRRHTEPQTTADHHSGLGIGHGRSPGLGHKRGGRQSHMTLTASLVIDPPRRADQVDHDGISTPPDGLTDRRCQTPREWWSHRSHPPSWELRHR